MENREERESRRKAGKRRRIKRTALILCAVLVLILSAYGAGSAYAKYVFNRSRSDVVKVKEFYFTSDLLGKTSENKAYTLNPGKNSFSFQLRNSADALRVSTADIKYTVTVQKPGEGEELVSATEVKATVDSSSETKNADGLTGSLIVSGTNAVSHTITLSGLALGQTYTVKVVGTAGFVEELTATFTTKAEEEAVYKHLDKSNPHYVILTVWTKDLAGTVTIDYPDDLIPDNTDMPDAVTGGTYTENFGKHSSQTYRFFTDGPSSYSVEQFDVKIGSTPAQSGTP